jgi:hypothetical protein
MRDYMTTLLAIYHDRTGHKLELFKEHILSIIELYDDAYLTISNVSDQRYVEFLKENNLKYKEIDALGAGHARREIVKFGLNSNSDLYHYCDGDRLLTWYIFHKEELRNLLKGINQNGYTVIGRTEDAFKSHPKAWIITEEITNNIVSILLNKELDVTAGSAAFDHKCAEAIASHSKDKMTDSEWPTLCKKSGYKIHSHNTNGLMYEHALNKAASTIGSTKEILNRVKLSIIISESALNLMEEVN